MGNAQAFDVDLTLDDDFGLVAADGVTKHPALDAIMPIPNGPLL